MPTSPDNSHSSQSFAKKIKLDHLKPAFFSERFELSLIAAFLLGAISSLSMAPYSFWPTMLIGIGGLYLLIGLIQKNASSSKKTLAFAIGWSYGFGFFFFGLSWVGNALLVDGNAFKWVYPLALCFLPALLALFHGIAAILTICLADMKKAHGLLFFASIFTLADWVRGTFFTGFPWNLFGHTWSGHIEMAQFASIAGIYGLGFLTIFCFGTSGYLILNWRHHKTYQSSEKLSLWLVTITALSIIATLYFYGQARLSANPTQFNKDVTIAIIQPNIQQDKKWDEKQKDFNFYRQLNTTLLAAQQSRLSGVNNSPLDINGSNAHSNSLPNSLPNSPPNTLAQTLVIWPETSFYTEYLNEPYRLAAVSNTLKIFDNPAYLIAGSVTRDVKDDLSIDYYNSLFVFSGDDNQIVNTYHKHHLVPFGEYIPLKDYYDIGTLIGFSPFSSGEAAVTLSPDKSLAPNIKTLQNRLINGAQGQVNKYIPFIPLICYESIFTQQVRAAYSHGLAHGNMPLIIINITNDAWFSDSAGPYQHLMQSRMRSIEMGLPLARSANTGISALYDSYGREIFTIKYNILHYGLSFLPMALEKPSFYAQHGNIPLFLIITIVSMICGLIKIRESLK